MFHNKAGRYLQHIKCTTQKSNISFKHPSLLHSYCKATGDMMIDRTKRHADANVMDPWIIPSGCCTKFIHSLSPRILRISAPWTKFIHSLSPRILRISAPWTKYVHSLSPRILRTCISAPWLCKHPGLHEMKGSCLEDRV